MLSTMTRRQRQEKKINVLADLRHILTEAGHEHRDVIAQVLRYAADKGLESEDLFWLATQLDGRL